MRKALAAFGLLAIIFVCMGGTAWSGTEISVIEPGTNRVLHFAQVSIVPTTGSQQPVRQGLTGLSGEPFAAEKRAPLDPAWKSLRVVVRKEGITGSTTLTYDADKDFWKPNQTLGDWRPDTVYKFDTMLNQWKAVPYEQWKAPLVARKTAFEQLDAPLADAMKKSKVDAALRALAKTGQTALATLVQQSLIRTNLAVSLGTVLATLSDPNPHAIDADLQRQIDSLRREVADSEVRSRPEPPTIEVMMERDFTVPVLRYVPVWPCESIYLFEPIMPRPGAGDSESKHAMLINWVGPPGTFPVYWLDEIARTSDESLERRLKGKIVLIGSLAERKNTPVQGEPRKAEWPLLSQQGEVSMSGLEIHANALDTILQRRFIRPMSTPCAWLLIFGCALLTTLSFRCLVTWRAVGVMVMEVLILLGLAQLLMQRDQWLYAVIPTAAILVSGITTAIWGYARSRQEATSLANTVEAMDSATSTLVHDLKQPLSVISALAAAIRAQRQAGGDGASPELLEKIQQQVEVALGDIDELLMVSPDRQVTLRKERFNLAAVASDLALAQSVKSPLHQVEVHAPPEGVFVSGDVGYLARALNNLMDNAIKYWPEGGTVRVEIEPGARNVTVSVVDQGLGMSPEQQSRIFGRFERVVPQGVDIPGTGIGLYSVKRIIEAHGGRVLVDSEPGVGSALRVTIPYTTPVSVPAQNG